MALAQRSLVFRRLRAAPYALLLLSCVALPRFALAQEAEGATLVQTPAPECSCEPETSSKYEDFELHRNTFTTRFIYARQFFSKDHPNLAEEAKSAENLYGFLLSYEREVIEGWLNIEVAKPFLWSSERFDSPFELTFSMPFRLAERWELALGVGMTLNVRVFDEEHEQVDEATNEISAGVAAVAGIQTFFTPEWGLTGAIEYTYIPGNVLVSDEFVVNFGPLFAFK